MTQREKIVKYLRSRKTPATAHEIAKYAKVNYNTVRREVRLIGQDNSPLPWFILHTTKRMCKVTNKLCNTYTTL